MALTGQADAASIRAARIRTVFGCFLAQNFMLGVAYGSFGPLLAANQAHLGVGRAVAASGMSLITLAVSLVAAIAGGLMQHVPVRNVMIAGVLVSGAAYLGLAYTSSFPIALFCYALIGLGIAVSGILSPLALVTRWVAEGRGKALSIVNLPFALFACPFLIGAVLPDIGRSAVLASLGCILFALAPILLLLVGERPPGQTAQEAQVSAAALPQSTSSIVRSPGFWLVSLGIALMAGCGIVFVVHIVAFGTGLGLPLTGATGLLSIYAGAGLIGTPLFGWLADRLGPPLASILSAACQALLWSLLLVAQGPALFLIAAGLGICCTPLVTLHGAALSSLFDPARVARAMGYSYLIKLPFIFGFAPAAGALFDVAGDYDVPFLLCSALMGVATLSFAGLWLLARRPATPSAAIA